MQLRCNLFTSFSQAVSPCVAFDVPPFSGLDLSQVTKTARNIFFDGKHVVFSCIFLLSNQGFHDLTIGMANDTKPTTW